MITEDVCNLPKNTWFSLRTERTSPSVSSNLHISRTEWEMGTLSGSYSCGNYETVSLRGRLKQRIQDYF